MFTAVVLDHPSRERLQSFGIPPEWTVKCHHMTLHMGRHNPSDLPLGTPVDLIVDAVGTNGKAMAVRISDSGKAKSKNTVPHVTLAVRIGHKPVESNDIKVWHPVDPITLRGIVEECH